MNERYKQYLELLKQSFNEQSFVEFVKDLLNLSPSDIANNFNEKKDVSNHYKESITHYKYVAKYNDGLNNIGVFIVKISDKTTTSNSRNMQRNFVAKLLSTYDLDSSIVSFYSDRESSWRISFVKKELGFGDKGFKEVLTPAKRYSYLVGEHESVHTAQEFLFKLLSIDSRKITQVDIEGVFDVEKVTKIFFEEYKEKYLQLNEYLDKNQDFMTESKNCDFNSIEFSKKLMGQIVFLYFLQKKGWLGVDLIPNHLSFEEYKELLSNTDRISQNLISSFYEKKDGIYILETNKLRQSEEQDIVNLTNIFINTKYNKPWGSGKKDFIRTIYKQSIKEHKNFFEEYLEPFFYKGLNEKRENQYFPLFNCMVPFLNGGLFEPLNNYRWSSAHFNIPNNIFSNEKKDGILDFLDLYNFTIDEEEPLEKEVAVDPEMLGKIFENLLDVNDRKSKGAFYTPREIVYYMCDESLANYLVNKLGVDYDEIINFIKYGDLISQVDGECFVNGKNNFEIGSTIYNNIISIDKTLIDIKIADPAVGSGAFPLGMLNEITKLRNNLTTYIMIQNKLGIINISDLSHSEQSKREIFDMKLQTIENSIYAVDIEVSAIDITKLRLWLSLIVDYPNNEEPKPLPNLDCKIMQGNSLIDEYQGIKLFSEKTLNNSLKKYMGKGSDIKYIKNIHIQQSLHFDDSCIDLNVYIENMLELQKEYFKTSDSSLKKELKAKIDDIQLGMVQESLKNDPKKLREFLKESKKKQKPWFIWELEFYDVFKYNGGFDIVISNPPYIDSESMSNEDPELRKRYAQKFKFAKGNWDIYIIFFELAYNLLNKYGNLIFITPDKWVSKPFGDVLRTKLYSRIKSVLIAGRKVFQSAKVDSIITNIMSNKVDYIEIKSLDNNDKRVINKNIISEPYRLDILFSNQLNLLLKIKSDTIELSDRFQVKTEGACATSDAYILKEIIKNDKFSDDNKFKIVNTGTISPFNNNYGKKAMTYLKDKYLFPVVYESEFFGKFNNKYSTMVNCKKIIMKGLNLLDGFIDDIGDFLPGKTTLVIKSVNIDDLKVILAFLQSKCVYYYINETYSSSSYNGGITFTKEMIDSIPIPSYSQEEKEIIIDLTTKIINGEETELNRSKLNSLINILYKLTDLEINIISNK